MDQKLNDILNDSEFSSVDKMILKSYAKNEITSDELIEIVGNNQDTFNFDEQFYFGWVDCFLKLNKLEK